MQKEITVSVSADTSNLQAKLRAISKHFISLADELESIDASKCSKCGSSDIESCDFIADNRPQYSSVKCLSCGHEENESYGDSVREATQEDFDRKHW